MTAHQQDEKTLSGYVIGVSLCLILTFAAFALVEYRFLSTKMSFIALGALAIAQLFVQSTCFLRLNASKEGRWSLLPYLFTILVVAILIGGSIWVMYNLNYNMLITTV